MKAVVLSIRPQWCEKIARGKKTIEVRKSAPKEVPFKAYIYCTKGRDLLREVSCWNTKTKIIKRNYRIINLNYCTNKIANGKVIGEFICDRINEYKFHKGVTEFKSMGLSSSIYGFYLIFADDYDSICLSYDEVKDYGKGKTLYGWHISDLKIYDKPKELSEFFTIADKSDCCCGCMWNATPLEEMPCRTCTGERKYLYRPPQSWQYVDEKKC